MKKKVHQPTPPPVDPDIERYREEAAAARDQGRPHPPTPTPSTERPLESYDPTPPSPPPLYVIHESLEEVQRHKEWKQELGDFLTYFDWDVYTIATFAYSVREDDHARRVGQEFVEGFGPEAFAFIAAERGDTGARLHLHLLIGGLSELAKNKGARRWQHGVVKKWEAYDPRGRAAWYVSKWPESSEFVGRLQRRTRRPRRQQSQESEQ